MIDVMIRPLAVRLLECLKAVRGLPEQPVRDAVEYEDRRWWAGDISRILPAWLRPRVRKPWPTISKARVPPPPPVSVILSATGRS